MEYKKSMIILMLTVFLISIASVCASDANETTIASENTIPIEMAQSDEITVNDDNQAIGQSNDKEIISEGNAGTFSELQENITATSSDTLELDRNYEYDDGFDTNVITIDKTITIDGKGHTINAKGQARVFNIQASDVTIKNLTIKNANYNGDGAAIYFAQSGRVINCNFATNQASGDGGAIWINSGSVENCNFTNNSAMGGGAVYFNRTGEVTCCNFVNNRIEIPKDGEGGGGALRFSKDGTIINCNFINNVAVESWGAAVYFDGHEATGTIINCNFTNNTATVDGGAISFNNPNIIGNVSGCNFANNTGRWGGAIDAEGLCNVSSCNFTYNKAFDGCGGAIYFNGNGEVTDCNFIDNSAWGKYNNGGAIQIYSGKVTYCNFTNNSASSDGGAISFSLNAEVTNCNFAKNKATSGEGGAIYIWDTYETGSTIENCNFTNNQATDGGAVYFRNNGNVENCNFTGNNAKNGGAILSSPMCYAIVAGCVFTGNSAFNGGAVDMYSGSIGDCDFTSNSATNAGGAAVFSEGGRLAYCNFEANTASKGGAVSMFTGNVENCNFTGNNATMGSAINCNGFSDTNISNSCFLNNRANASADDSFNVTVNGNTLEIAFMGQNNLLNAIYSNGNINFTNVTYWGFNGIAKTGDDSIVISPSNCEAGQNISIAGVVNGNILNTTKVTDENGKIVVENSIYYYLVLRHDGDYYYTEAEKTISNIKFNVNVTSQTTTNRTVNITAKSNIPQDIVQGKLLFILPNGDEINATYGDNGTWWAEHTFEDWGVYQVNASYEGLDNVTVNKGTLTVIPPEHTFSFLNYTVNSNDDSVINLSNDFYFDSAYDSAFAEGIVINRPVTVNGNGYTIDANGKSRIFYVTSSDVVLENITFKNGHATYGGAVYFSDTGTVTNCYFTNNTASYGGAVYFQGIGSVTNCNFIDNKATGRDRIGGAVYFMDGGDVTNCNFTDNTASYGGAVYFMDGGDVTNCNFTDNTASYGGAVYFEHAGEVRNCNFTDNTASYGGAVYLQSTGYVTNCNFTNNTVNNRGGAVFFLINGKVTYCNFTDNTASYGGAVCFDYTGEVKNCNFTDNTASYGGAVYFMDGGDVTNCNFTDNTASYGGAVYFEHAGEVRNCNFTYNTANYGGAVYFDRAGEVRNCNFTHNFAFENGGAICFNDFSSIGDVINCNFVNNSARRMGGAIHMISGSVVNCDFVNNTAGSGCAVYIYHPGNVSNCNFVSNSARSGGVVWLAGGDVSNCNFVSNSAASGGAVYFTGDGNVTNCNFTDNNAANNGGAVYFNKNGAVTNCNFTGNNATSGSAIYFNSASGSKTISHSTFLNNRANVDTDTPLNIAINEKGIEIIFMGRNNLLNAIYSRDDAEVTFANVTYWGANGIANTGEVSVKPSRSNREAGQNITVEIYDSSDMLVENVTLVSDDNGQVKFYFVNLENGDYKYMVYHSQDQYYTYAETNGNFTVELGDFTRLQCIIDISYWNSVIDLNRNYTFTAGLDDGLTSGIVVNKQVTINGNGFAIDADGKARIFYVEHDAVLKDITFINGNATGFGGAVSFIQFAKLINCDFVNNTADRGGAVYFRDNFDVINCDFVNNTADRGGAVYYSLGISNVSSMTNCNFTNNAASVGGGAIYLSYGNHGATLNIANCNFVDNSASIEGGAAFISNSRGSNSVVNCNFTGNTAEIGGAVFLGSKIGVTSCNFMDNFASIDGGAAYFINGGILTNCNFADNFASSNGGAVSFNARGNGECDVVNCNFTGNNATSGSGIYFYSRPTAKTISNSIFLNNRANADTDTPLHIIKIGNNIEITFMGQDNLLNAIYSSEDVNVENVTYWGANGIANTGNSTIAPFRSQNESGQNITVIGFVNGKVLNATKVTNEDGKIVLEDVTGDYYLIVRHDADQYYTYAETVSTNMKLYVNVTSIATNNKTVNITAKSNVPQDIIEGKLLFIFPNGDRINASYDGKGTWWTVYTFDDYAEYDVNASYVGLDNVTVNNGNIAITKANSTITLEDIVLNYGESINVTVKSTGATGITAAIDGNNVTVFNNFTIPVSGLSGGNHTLTVTTIPDADHNCVTKNVNITVNKAHAEIILANETLDLKVNDMGTISANLTPSCAGNLTFVSSNESVVMISEEGFYLAYGKGTAIITVSSTGNENYTAAKNRTITVTVTLRDASVSVKNATLDLKVGDRFDLNATSVPDFLNIQYVSSNPSVVSITDYGIVTAEGEGIAIITLTVGNNQTYAINSTNVTVTVSKIATQINITNVTLDLKALDTVSDFANLTPADAGNLTFVSSDESVVVVENGTIVAVGAGKANITVSFAGDYKYTPAENRTISITVTVNDASINVTRTLYELFVGESDNIIAVTVPDDLKVKFDTDDDKIISVDDAGKITAVGEGNATIFVSVGDNVVYKYDVVHVNVIVSRMATSIASSAVTAVYNVNKNLVVTLKDAKGNPIGGAKVTIDLKGAKTYTTDGNGQVKVSTKSLVPKAYTAKITFDGNAKYVKSSKDVKVTVKKAKPKIIAKKKTYKAKSKNKKFKMTLKDNKGKPIKKAKVRLIVYNMAKKKSSKKKSSKSKKKYKPYILKTNKKGKITFKIKRFQKVTYKAVLIYKGNKYYTKVSKSVKIKLK